jgi:hypothetical protein
MDDLIACIATLKPELAAAQPSAHAPGSLRIAAGNTFVIPAKAGTQGIGRLMDRGSVLPRRPG